MGIVTAQITMTLDGYIAGPNDRVDNPLGDGGKQIHRWVYQLANWRASHGQTGGVMNRDAEIIEEHTSAIGAYVMGRRMFDHGEEPWGPNPPFHAPVFVLTNRPREIVQREGGTTFSFVTDGIEHAIALAKTAAGEKNVDIAGGAQAVQQAMAAGLLDEIEVHISPLFLGGGVHLFDQAALANTRLEQIRVVESPEVTHIRYRCVS